MPDTVTAVPIVVPPLEQGAGGLVCGPNTVNVIVPPPPLVAPDRVALIELVGIAVPWTSICGAVTVIAVAFLTTVEVIPVPHVLVAAWLLESPV